MIKSTLKTLLLFLCSSSLFCQNNSAITIGADFGLLQLNKSLTTNSAYQTLYIPRLSPYISASKNIAKTALSLEIGLRYSYSSIVIKEGFEPLFPKGEGFPSIRYNNEYFEIPILAKIQLLKKEKKFNLHSILGISIGIPLPFEQNLNFVEDSLFAYSGGNVWKLNYFILRTTHRAVVSIESGLGFDLKMNDNWYLTGNIYYRLGLYQAVTLNYTGEIYINSNPDPYINSFETSFSNNGILSTIGIKRTF